MVGELPAFSTCVRGKYHTEFRQSRKTIVRSLFGPFKFAAQLNRLTVWLHESELDNVLVRVNCGEHHTLHQSSSSAPGDVDKIELTRLSVRRHLSFKASPIAAITVMGREQTI